MLIKDSGIIGQIESIGNHYRTNIATQYIRPALLQLPLDKHTWDQLEIFTDRFEEIWHYGITLEELYRIILSAAHFVLVSRRELASIFRNRPAGGNSESERVLRDMAVKNIFPNIDIFAEQLKKLCETVKQYDKSEAKGRDPVYLSVPEIMEMGKLLKK